MSSMSSEVGPELFERVRKARRWARVAGARALDAYGNVTSERKGDNQGLVTELDRSIETFLRQKIDENYPGERVVGEEFAPEGNNAETTWYLDPIDGTAAYSMNLPIWTVCIGIARRNEPRAGVMWSPAVNDEYHGWSGGVFKKNNTDMSNEPIRVSDWDDESLLCIRSDTHRRFEVQFPGKCRSLGSSAYHMGLVLDGRAVGALLGQLHVWDIGAAAGLAADTDFCLESLTGSKPDWKNLAAGNYSRENLLFSHREIIDELQRRIDIKK